MDSNLSFKNVIEAYSRIQPYVHQTPVLTCSTFNQMSGLELFFKCENLQKTGAFKARGACNAVLLEKQDSPNLKGIVTHSSGNHGLAVAYACSKGVANIPCSVVVPSNTPTIKCEAIKGYGASLVFCQPSPVARIEACNEIAEEKGYSIIHSYDNYNVMAGQGTIAYEMLEVQNYRDLDAILVSVSGGGMASGIAIAAKSINPNIKGTKAIAC